MKDGHFERILLLYSCYWKIFSLALCKLLFLYPHYVLANAGSWERLWVSSESSGGMPTCALGWQCLRGMQGALGEEAQEGMGSLQCWLIARVCGFSREDPRTHLSAKSKASVRVLSPKVVMWDKGD